FYDHEVCLHQQHVTWQGIQAKKIIFCEGYQMMNNPFFDWLPMQPAHGEIISCQTSAPLDPHIINQSKWLLPTAQHQCKIGATYEPTLRKPTLQATSKQSLLAFANTLFKHDMGFNVTQHQAGIRPATKDKQPFIGFHPKHAQLAVFNGFGSRGSLLIPWYASIFSQHLQHQQILPAHADINRYSTLCV
ncbi:MAG: FAD-dependent oxidoreductase, partial [Ghiorsea sp.]